MSTFAHTLLRSGRFIVRGNRSNPVQYALGQKGSIKYTALCRTYATAFTRDKEHVNIGKIRLKRDTVSID
jgi:elongation factor Tu